MRIVRFNGCTYQVTFEHPDYGREFHEFVVDDDNEPSVFAEDEIWAEYNKEIARNVWKQFNSSGYYHTMTITAEYVIDGKAYTSNICEDASIYDVM